MKLLLQWFPTSTVKRTKMQEGAQSHANIRKTRFCEGENTAEEKVFYFAVVTRATINPWVNIYWVFTRLWAMCDEAHSYQRLSGDLTQWDHHPTFTKDSAWGSATWWERWMSNQISISLLMSLSGVTLKEPTKMTSYSASRLSSSTWHFRNSPWWQNRGPSDKLNDAEITQDMKTKKRRWCTH